MPGTVRILSIDGGGIRGIIPARILEHIEARTGRRISELFHLVAGTSTGGIIACALTSPAPNGRPRPASEIADLYRQRGREIFQSSFWHGFGSLGGLVDEKYEARHLEDILEAFFGDTMLSEVHQDLLVTSYDLQTRKPFFFKSWKARGEHVREEEAAVQRDFEVRWVARATSAAPTYFEPAVLKKRNRTLPLVDGGVFANNPAMCALTAARKLFPRASRTMVLSLGTGETRRTIPYEEARDWGLAGWARPLLYIIFDGVSDAVDYHLSMLLSQRDYFRFQTAMSSAPDDEDAPNDDMDDARPENIRLLERLSQDILQRDRQKMNRLVRQLRTPMAPRDQLSGP